MVEDLLNLGMRKESKEEARGRRALGDMVVAEAPAVSFVSMGKSWLSLEVKSRALMEVV